MASNFGHTKSTGHKVTFKSGHTIANLESSARYVPVQRSPVATILKTTYQSKARVFVLAGVGWESLGGLAAPLPFTLNVKNNPSGASIIVYPENFSGESHTKPLMESALIHTSQFLMTTSKFGAWRDPSGTTYGLGFPSITERDAFAIAFTSAVDSLKGTEASGMKEEETQETFPTTTTNLMQDILESSREAETQEMADRKKISELSAEERLFGVIARLKGECEEVKRGSLERREAEEAVQAELATKEKEVSDLRSQVEKERHSRLTMETELTEARAEAAVLRERLRQMEAEVERSEDERAGVDKILDGELSTSINAFVNIVAKLKAANNLGGTNK